MNASPGPNDLEAPRLLTVSQSTRLAGRPRSSWYRFLKSGGVPGAVIALPGHQLLVRRAVLERWLAGEHGPSAPDSAAEHSGNGPETQTPGSPSQSFPASA